jgi:hypothetical protein
MGKRTKVISLLTAIALSGVLAACHSHNDRGPAERAGSKIDEGMHKLGEKMEEGGEKMQDKFE